MRRDHDVSAAGLSVLATALIIFYPFSIRQNAVVSDRFMDEAETLIRKGDYLGLLQNRSRRNECIARVTQKTLDFATKNPTATFEDVREVTEAEGTRQASLLSQRMAMLADIITVAPMIGLLGTVIGMISEMRAISNSVNSVQIGFASGVAEALIATAGGLMMAIPCVLAYAVFRGRVQRLVAELEAAATHLMALLSAQYKKATARAAAQRAATAARSRPPRRMTAGPLHEIPQDDAPRRDGDSDRPADRCDDSPARVLRHLVEVFAV